ncbi:Na+-driven multidrug efflux pump [Aequitasia blattaphilus]
MKEKELQKQFILKGNLWKVMFQLSWPAVVAMVLYGFNTVLDGIFVGRFVGETALAGVSLAYPITQLSTAFGSLIAMMGGSGESLTLGVNYFRITIFGSIFWIYGLAGNMIIRAEGRMKTAAWMMGAGLLVNAVSNYIFIVILHMGVEGAAWGTNVGMLAYSVLGWVYFARGKSSFDCKVASLKYTKETATDILRLGMSSLMMSIMSLVQAVVVFNALAKYGTTSDVAFYGIVYRIFQFMLTPIFGLMRALQPAIGINYGAKRYDRVISAYKIFGVAAMLLTIPFWLFSLISPGTVLGLMLPGQAFTITQFGFLRIQMAILPVMSFIFMAMTLFPAIDKGMPAMVIGMARQFVFYVPVMLILPRFVGVAGIYIGSFAIDSVIVLWTLWMVKRKFNLLRGRRMEMKVCPTGEA